MSSCCCSLAGTAACRYCKNNPFADRSPLLCTFQDTPTYKVTVTVQQTNADRIRSMTDEELAEYLANICYDLWKMFVADPKKMWLNWLKAAAKE